MAPPHATVCTKYIEQHRLKMRQFFRQIALYRYLKDVMTPRDQMITAREGITLPDANTVLVSDQK